MHWLRTEGAHLLHIIVLTETRMAHDMEFSCPTHHVIHNAGKHAGILILLQKQLAPSHRISWNTPIPGRVVHVRMYGTRRHVDVVGIYQHAWRVPHTEQCLKDRQQCLKQIGKVLQKCSPNQLLFMGVISTPSYHPLASSSVPLATSRAQAADWHSLCDQVKKYELGALNTHAKWHPAFAGPGPKKRP